MIRSIWHRIRKRLRRLAMTRAEALRIADLQLRDAIRSDPSVMAAAGNDTGRIFLAALRAREKLADKILAGEA